MIALENLTKSYRVAKGRHYVFRDVSVTFPEGANIGIIGPNGAGKSTLLSILGRVDFPDSGRIVSNHTFSWPLGLSGGFLGHLSGRENCRMVCNLYGLTHDAIRSKVGQIKELSGIGDYFEEPVSYYSSGMGSRLGFALSMAFDFDYFLIDEITSVGDANFRDLAKAALEQKARQSRVIMVSHNMGDVKKFCDVGIMVKDGQVSVFDSLDKAIRAYLPQTQEAATADTEQARITIEDTGISGVALPEHLHKLLPEIRSRLEAIEQLLANPSHSIAGPEDAFYRRLAAIFEALGDTIRARKHYRKTAELNPVSLQVQLKLSVLAYQVGDRAEEESALKAAEALDPKNLSVLSARIKFSLRNGNSDEALAASDMAIRVNPTSAAVWAERAHILLTKGDTRSALEAQVKAIRFSPRDQRLYQQIARLLASEGDFEASAQAREKALSLMKREVTPPRHPPYSTILTSIRTLGDTITV